MCKKDKPVMVIFALVILLGGYLILLCGLYYKLLLKNSILYVEEVDVVEED